MYKAIDISGKRFGRLTVIARYLKKSANRKGAYWNCKCDCGVEKIIRGSALRRGVTRSCGCLVLDTRHVVHGGCGSPEHTAWGNIKSRCYNPNAINYEHYGGRGIKMCQGWKYNFINFLSDVGKRPSDKYSVDRIENDGYYSCGKCKECIKNGWKSNCRWALQEVQKRNTRRNRWIEYNGEKMVLKDWATRFGIDDRRLIDELKKRSFEDAIHYLIKIKIPGRISGSRHHAARKVGKILTDGSIKEYPLMSVAIKDGYSVSGIIQAIKNNGLHLGFHWVYLN